MKYIDADKLIKAIEEKGLECSFAMKMERLATLALIDELKQEQQDFPTTDEEIEMFLATHPKVEVPQKYKTPDWLWKQQEQQKVDLEDELDKFYKELDFGPSEAIEYETHKQIARHFYELGLNARKEK